MIQGIIDNWVQKITGLGSPFPREPSMWLAVATLMTYSMRLRWSFVCIRNPWPIYGYLGGLETLGSIRRDCKNSTVKESLEDTKGMPVLLYFGQISESFVLVRVPFKVGQFVNNNIYWLKLKE